MSARQGWRARLGWKLRCWADRVDEANCPKRLSTLSFTFEEGEGIRFREDRRGCPLAYMSEADYARARDEADSAMVETARNVKLVEDLGALGPDGMRIMAERLGITRAVILAEQELLGAQRALADAAEAVRSARRDAAARRDRAQ